MGKLITTREQALGCEPTWALDADADYLLACGLLWHRTADREAGEELVRALQSGDPNIRVLAEALLIKGGKESMSLLDDAVASGWLDVHVAAPCLASMMHHQIQHEAPSTMKWLVVETSRC